MYFSPTGTTQKIVQGVANALAAGLYEHSDPVTNYDFTLPGGRETAPPFTGEDVVVFGVPVYAGRVPNILLKYLDTISGQGALAVAVVVYGNRHYDDAALELKTILEEKGFQVMAAGAFIGEHSFSKILGQDRPDDDDMAVAAQFAQQIADKIRQNKTAPVTVPGNKPYRAYYMPKDQEDRPVDIRKVTPKTSEDCIDCKVCVTVCPMGSIDEEDVSKLNGICIKCGACIKQCPMDAKYFDDADYVRHKEELEAEFSPLRREPELFLVEE